MIGPAGFPLFGNLLQMAVNPHKAIFSWISKYGSMFQIHLGSRPTLIISDLKLLEELFSMIPGTGRFQTEVMELTTNGYYGIGNSEGAAWIEQRKFSIKALGRLGFDQASKMDQALLLQAHQLLSWIENEQNKSNKVLLNFCLKYYSSNFMWTLIRGKGTASENKRALQIVDEWLESLLKTAETGLTILPWLKIIAPSLSGYTKAKQACLALNQYVVDCFNKRLIEGVKCPPGDLLDAVISEIQNCSNQKSSFYGDEGWRHGFATINAWLTGSSESTGTVLNWILFCLARFPIIQCKLQKEIDNIWGKGGVPTMSDMQK